MFGVQGYDKKLLGVIVRVRIRVRVDVRSMVRVSKLLVSD